MTAPLKIEIAFSTRKSELWPGNVSTRGPAISKHAINTEHETRLPPQDRLAALLLLGLEPKFTPAKFRAMHKAGLDPTDAVRDPLCLPQADDRLRQSIEFNIEDYSRDRMKWAKELLARAEACSASILVHGDPEYPARLYDSKHPVPILYVLGDPAILSHERSVAIVGSDRTRNPYLGLAREFSATAARNDICVVSGFSAEVDAQCHSSAVQAGGPTVCVFPCGVNRAFPNGNRRFWKQLLKHRNAVFVSEHCFGETATETRFQERHKLISALSQCVLVAQAERTGGPMLAYRQAQDEGKPMATFEPDGSGDTEGNGRIADDKRTGAHVFEQDAGNDEFVAWLDRATPAEPKEHGREFVGGLF